MATWTRRQVLAQMGIAAAAVHTLVPHELCCAVPAHAQTATKDLFELKKAADDKATLAEMQTKIGDQLAGKYEAGMSKYPLGRYRDRIGQNVEMVYKKVVQKA